MDSKLTLKLDKDVIEQAKGYAARRGVSLSQMVEGYFRSLARTEERRPVQVSGVVAELAGILAGVDAGNLQDEYTEHLRKKYS